MGLALVSQQPGHVPDELFELVNTRFIHQLKSSFNLAPVRGTTGGVHDALWFTVPSLAPGQCLLTGAVFRTPVFTAVRPAASLFTNREPVRTLNQNLYYLKDRERNHLCSVQNVDIVTRI